jgi:hypothetical protein
VFSKTRQSRPRDGVLGPWDGEVSVAADDDDDDDDAAGVDVGREAVLPEASVHYYDGEVSHDVDDRILHGQVGALVVAIDRGSLGYIKHHIVELPDRADLGDCDALMVNQQTRIMMMNYWRLAMGCCGSS